MDISPWPVGLKLVHLDLKGAPPRIDYLLKLIHLFAEVGANGILIEYEDMFPYEGEVKVLQSTAHPPYSRDEILLIQEVAKSKGLEVIPLVQTFGHLEFVLKHRSFWDLREVGHCVGTLNPHRERGVRLIKEMLRQVLELHPGIKTLHIGADEVYLLGEGEESQRWLSTPGHTLQQLFLGHVRKVASGVRETRPHLDVIMWDDMMRQMDPATLSGSGLVGLVQPMLWDYNPSLDVQHVVAVLEKYRDAGFSQVWAASSFKGATTVDTCVTSTQRHVDNQLQWLKVASALPHGLAMLGIALTGWQRYDHMSVLCELMPLGVPSLTSCLQTLLNGSFSQEAQTKVTEILGVSSVEVADIDGSSADDGSSFVGKKLAGLVVELTGLLQSEEVVHFQNNLFMRGWFSPFHRQTKQVNLLIVQQLHDQAKMLSGVVEKKVEEQREEMCRLFPASSAHEWVEQHVVPVLAPLQSITEETQVCLQGMGPETPPHTDFM